MSTRFGLFPGVITQGRNGINPLVDNGDEWVGLSVQKDWEKRASATIYFLSSFVDTVKLTTPWDKTKQTWNDRMNQILHSEKAEEVSSKVEFDAMYPKLEYWCRDGKVTRMIIHKPIRAEHLDDLNYWMVYLFCDGHNKEQVVKGVNSLMYAERYLLAWYALWRKWQIAYKVWKWAAGRNEVIDPFKPPNSSDWYMLKNQEWEDNSGFVCIPPTNWLSWYPYTDPTKEGMLFGEE